MALYFKRHIVNFFTGALVLVWVLSSAAAQAQTTYPVQVNAHLLPPYSLYLSDYYSGTREKLTVTLINRDQFTPSLTVRLRMTITAQGGVRMQTNDNAFFQPIVVDSGLPVRLTLEDLAPYFQPANLIAQGAVAGGKLPEGMIEFCFQVFEAYTSQPLSQPTCARAWITSQKPPLLSLPGNNESIAFRDPLSLMFQWTPRHHGLTYVEYDFILKELWDNGMAPQAAFAYAPEIYRETVRGTSLIYGALHPPLLPGKRYAWAVRAQAREGVDAVNLFQNDGLSEIRWFTLQDNCDPLQFVVAEPEKKRLNVRWNRLPEHIGYTVSYRLVDNTSSGFRSAEWTEVETQESQTIVSGLKNGGTYEYRVGSFCAPGQAVYSPIFVTTLPETDSARLAQCGIMPAINLANQSPLGELKTGEVIMASDYPVTITRLSGAQGVYSGEGWTIIPWLNDAKIAVRFSNITVNSDRQMIAGYIDAQYDRAEGQIANVDDLTEGGFDVGAVKNGITKVDYKFDFSIPGVDAFSLNDEGELVIHDSQGVPHTVSSENREGQGNEGNKVFPMTVEDKDGNVYQVEKVVERDASGAEKEVAKATFIGKSGPPLTQDNFDPSQLNGDKAIVTFNNGGGYYAFDTWKDYYGNVALIKPKYEKLFTNYYVPWKLLPPGKKDVVGAKIAIKDSSIDPRKVIFKTPKGIQFQAEYSDDTKTYSIQLAGGEAGDAQDVFALYPTSENKYWNLGKLSVASYAEQTFTVVLVPVNNVLIEEAVIEQRLKEIYGPVGIRWEIVKAGNFLYDETKTQLMANSTGIRTYTEAMRALNNQYHTEREFNSKANYLFFLKATGAAIKNNRDAVAFMPRGGQFGYIFTSEIRDENEPTTVAHELGHGRFKLFHTFDEHYGGFERGQTDNLMDYRDGTYVAKWQWDVMSDPAYVVNVFESDVKSANLATNSLPKDFLNGETYNFVTVTGKKITLPAACVVTFGFGISSETEINYPIGYLYSFEIFNKQKESIKYTANIRGNQFLGYVDSGNKPYVDNLTANDRNENVILFAPEEEGIRYLKLTAALPAYSLNDVISDFKDFPIQPYLTNEILKKSDLITYNKIGSLLRNQGEDWTLHKEFFSSVLSKHNTAREHWAMVKIIELRTAYRELFNEFTDEACFDRWSADLTKDIGNAETVIVPCAGRWEAILKAEPSLLELQQIDPASFYRRFLNEFTVFITEGKSRKSNFLANLSLSTTQSDVFEFLGICSNGEVGKFSWENRKTLLKVVTRRSIHDTGHPTAERDIVRLVKYLPAGDRDKLLTTLVTEKDADDQGLLLYRLMGQTYDDLNDREFYDFVATIHAYADGKYKYDKSPLALAKNRMANRYFSFDPSFWVEKPVAIQMKENGNINFAFRTQFWFSTYEPVEVDPYASVTLHFEDDKTTGQFLLDKEQNYTTSGIMAYAICYSAISDQLKIGGFVVLNTVLMATGIGELNAALQAGRIGGAILGGTDIALGMGAILVETEYKEAWRRTEDGKAVLQFWEAANLLYAGGRITQALYNSAVSAKVAANNLKATADDAEMALLNETEAQADNVISKKIGDEISFTDGSPQDDLWDDFARIGDGADLNSVQNILRVESALKNAFKPGWSRQKLAAYTKPFPPPEQYLNRAYIDSHLEKFKDGVSFICPEDAFEAYKMLLGRSDGVYVIPKARMDDLLSRTQGDISKIETELSIPPGDWQKGKLIRIDVLNLEDLELRMPSGNEAAANKYFTPGGVTADGQIEAVINAVPEGMYEAHPID